MFRHVSIDSNGSVAFPLSDSFFPQVIKFLNALNNSRLLSIKFIGRGELKLLRMCEESFYRDLFGATVRFLESQNNLRSVEFRNSRFSFDGAAEVMKTLSENSAETLEKLILRRFVDGGGGDVCTYEKFVNLTYLEVDYSRFFERMFSGVTKNHALSRIVLHCDDSVERTDVEGIAWEHPALKVELYYVAGFEGQEVDFYITPKMPLVLLDYSRYRWVTGHSDIGALFRHLYLCRSHLESLNIIWLTPIADDMAPVLIPFLRACTKLTRFQLHTLLPPPGFEVVLKSWIDNKPCRLKEVKISISTDDGLSRLIDEYARRLQAVGLNVYLTME